MSHAKHHSECIKYACLLKTVDVKEFVKCIMGISIEVVDFIG